MKLSRRNFLKLSGLAALTGTLAAKLGCAPKDGDEGPPPADAEELRIQYADEVATICPICGVGCGVICYVEDGKIVGTEGDPDHPISEGALCSKGSGLFCMYYVYEDGEVKVNPSRMTQVLYRAPKAADWEVKDWDWALTEVAKRIKKTRDDYFVEKNADGVTVNRCTALAWLGSAMCNNEENYLFQKMCRALGVTNVDHCARL
ncbi:MAG: hypothetical protein CVU88_03270 [Firmicutes bacterium HGW-Firmicutes-13]|nr:MAG: hypothetical protein CVU88_03270 [Firmicutes bacterium HGW-Firmicutes-13]